MKSQVTFYHYHGLQNYLRQTSAHFINTQNNTIDEELEELDEGHDGKAKPQTENSAWVRDVLQQLKHTPAIQYLWRHCDYMYMKTMKICIT